MKFTRRYSVVNLLTTAIVAVTIVSFACLYLIWVVDYINSFHTKSVELKNTYIEQQEKLIRNELEAAVDYIRFNQRQVKKRVRKQLKERVDEAWSIADNLYNNFSHTLSKEELESIVREALRAVTFNNGRGYYFATDLNGIEQLFTDRPEFEGKDLSNMKDPRGRPVIQDMIRLVQEEEAGYYNYYWTRPEKQGNDYYKLSYIRLFEKFSWFIGSGEYVDDMEEDVKKEVVERIEQIRFGKDGYIFILSDEGVMLSHPDKTFVGNNVTTTTSLYYNKLFQQIIQIGKNKQGGTISYVWPKLHDPDETEKYSCILYFPEWDWVLGAGFYLDELEEQLAVSREQMRSQLVSTSIRIAFLIVLIIVVTGLVSKYLSGRIGRNIKLFNTFFEKSALEQNKIESDKVVFKEFETIARAANSMIEERAKAEKEKEDLQIHLQQSQKLEAIGTLAGGIAHDFNNLLTAIAGNLSLLRRSSLDNGAMKKLDAMEMAVARATELVRQILAFSRKSPSQFEYVDLAEVVTEAVSLLRSSIPSSIRIVEEISLHPLVVYADATQMQQIVMNLGTNAFQALERGKGEIVIRLEKCKGEPGCKLPAILQASAVARLSVCDNGAGIAPEYLSQIFDPYFSTKKAGEGTGLGLSVIYNIIRKHQGHIDVDSTPGEGTVFQVYLPVVEGLVSENKEKKGEIVEGEGAILLVDDDPLVLQTSTSMLSELGYIVTVASKGREALEILSQHSFDMLITDQTMPGMSGLELIKQVRKKNASMPVLLITGYSERVNAEAVKQAGCNEYLLKPLDLYELSTTVSKIMN